MTNPAAQAWIDASRDLGIRYVHPFTFMTRDGRTATTTGGWLPEFGGPLGTVLTTRFDDDWLDDEIVGLGYYTSRLSPHSYEPYRREIYIETLNDSGWYGPPEAKPSWYTAEPWTT